MSLEPGGNTLITNEELSGTWTYKCEVLLPERFFPEEYVHGDKKLPANFHGGTVNFNIVNNDGSVEINGQREWREHLDKKNGIVVKEIIKDPIQWNKILSILINGKQLLYQYRIKGLEDEINGITHVHLGKNIQDKLVLLGFFYYVPAHNLLHTIEEKADKSAGGGLTQYKQSTHWLDLFGKVILEKIK